MQVPKFCRKQLVGYVIRLVQQMRASVRELAQPASPLKWLL